MTGSASDPLDWQPHIRNKPRREALAKRFKDAERSAQVVIVRDMWLTGFDAPSLHTMYVDKPMRGHGLMQAIARVNRVFRDKPGGLVVDYLGLADELKAGAGDLHRERRHGADGPRPGRGRGRDAGEARGLLRRSSTASTGRRGRPARRRSGSASCPPAQEHILAQENGKDRFLHAVRELSQAFALAVPHDEALRIRDDVGLLPGGAGGARQARPGDARPEEELDHAVRQIVSRAVAPGRVVDIFAAAGLEKPDISILSDEFLAEVRGMPQRNLAVELLRKLLNGEIKTAPAQERRPGALVRRDAGAGDPRATRTAPSRRRR